MPRIESLTWRQNTREEVNPPIPAQIVDTNSVFPDVGISGTKITDLEIGRLRAGEIVSKAITLGVNDGTGDAYIGSGKSDFTTTDSGFIIGVDDSDSNKAKAYFGNSTEYFYWNGTAMAMTGGIIVDGSITVGKLSTGEGVNLLPNQYADFEQYVDGRAVATAWNGTAVASTDTCYSGTQSLKMVASAGDNYTYLSTSQTAYNIPCTASTKYIISAYIKGAAGSEQCNVYLKYSDGTHSADGVPVDVTTSWVRYSWVKTSPAGVTAMILRLDNDDNGATVYWDKIQVEKANQTAASPEATDWKSGATVFIDGGSIYAGSKVLAGVGTNMAGITGENAAGTGAGSTDSDIRIFAGDTYANRATADFSVTQGGLVTASGFSTNLFRGISTASIGGDGTDGALTLTSGTTNLSLNTVYNYSSVSLTGTAILSTAGQGGVMILKTTGNFTCTGSAKIDLKGKGGLGGQSTTLSAPGTLPLNPGTDGYISEIDGGTGTNIHYGQCGQVAGNIITGSGGGANVTTAGASGAVSGGYPGGIGGYAVSVITPTTIPFLAYQGCGGASGAGGISSGGAGDSLTGSFGGNGGAGLYIESKGVFNFTGTFDTSGGAGTAASGVAGTSPWNASGASGGGAAGHIYVAVSGNNTNTNTGTYTMTAGAVGAGIVLAGVITLSAAGAGGAGSRNFDRRW